MKVHVQYISDDGLIVGDEATVSAYEAKQKNPLAKMRFPYAEGDRHLWTEASHVVDMPEKRVVVAAANLMPLIEEVYEDWTHRSYFTQATTEKFFKEYEKVREMAKAL